MLVLSSCVRIIWPLLRLNELCDASRAEHEPRYSSNLFSRDCVACLDVVKILLVVEFLLRREIVDVELSDVWIDFYVRRK